MASSCRMGYKRHCLELVKHKQRCSEFLLKIERQNWETGTVVKIHWEWEGGKVGVLFKQANFSFYVAKDQIN